jgi:hypothetical protein
MMEIISFFVCKISKKDVKKALQINKKIVI